MDYEHFIREKSQYRHEDGFDPCELPEFLFDFQKYLVDWACRKGRSAIFADCGMGKTAMQLAFAQQVIERENKPALIVTPLAVGAQTVTEAAKFGIDAQRTRDGRFDGTKCVWVTNYEQLAKYDPTKFAAVICDESSAIKDFKSQRKDVVVEFMRRVKYRLLCTATAAPNDFWELGTSSEALGLLGFRDMITTFFKQETSKDHHGWGRTKYRFRGHAQGPFWAWVCSWARSIQTPADIGFDGSRFKLPALNEIEHTVESTVKRDGYLFDMSATDLQEEREERRRTIPDRVAKVASIVNGRGDQSIIWCELNDEATALRSAIEHSVEVHGSMSDDAKEEALIGFANGQIKNLITKPKIGAWGLNFQNCSNVVTFPSHSFEQYYQSIRRCWRFGQTKHVDVHIVTSEGQSGILKNLRRKQDQVNTMFRELVAHMRDAMHLTSSDYFPEEAKVPKWLA
jgi:KaiC/GvpD/RAD55 family RecA-like ATPase